MENEEITRDAQSYKLIVQLIKTGKLNTEQMNNLYKNNNGEEVANAIVEQIIGKGSITEQVETANTFFYNEDKYALLCCEKISKQIKWSELGFGKLMEIGRALPDEGTLPMFLWREICKHIQWQNLIFAQKMEVGTTGMWTEVWEEVAKYIDWQTLSAEKMVQICEKAMYRAVVLPVLKTGKLNGEQTMKVLSKSEDDEIYEGLTTDFNWSVLSIDEMISIGTTANSPTVWEAIHKQISSLQ